jgi:predicted metal-dependent hydrolase
LDYTVRVSPRARRVRLVIKADGTLEVVVPRRFAKRAIPGIVESKRDWVERTRVKLEARRRELQADPPRLPDRIMLGALGEEWMVEYRLAAFGVTRTGVRESPGRLVVTGPAGDPVACRDALCRWLTRTARGTLVPWLDELAADHDLPYSKASIRQQRTRWGSCSRRGSISLNARLLFLPPRLVEYVLLHELCHTKQLNHSPRFWALLGSHDPECDAHRKALRTAKAVVPSWLDHDLVEPGV